MAVETAITHLGHGLKRSFGMQRRRIPKIILGKYNNFNEINRLRTTLEKSNYQNGLFRNLRLIENKFYVSNINVLRQADGNNCSLELIPNCDLRYIYPIAKHVLNVWLSNNLDKNDINDINGINGKFNYDVNVHLTRQVCKINETQENGLSQLSKLHKSGADFLMSGLVLNLDNVKGAVSNICDSNDLNNTLISHKLDVGEYLIHDDKEYLHNVSLMESNDGINDAIRDVISVYVHRL